MAIAHRARFFGATRDRHRERRARRWYIASWAVVGAFASWMVIALLVSQPAQAFGAGLVFAGLGALTLLGGHPYGAFNVLIGEDCRTSTSKTQAALWTLLLVWGVAFLLGRHLFERQDLAAVLPQSTWDQYLVVLGGPFAAAVLAKGVVVYQTSNGSLTKTSVGPDDATVGQLLQNDNRQTDLVDSQYFLFNLVAMVYFVVQIARVPVLPAMPATLLASTSGAAALYVAYKAVSSSNMPSISSVTPRTARGGQQLTLTGTNMLGGGDPSQVKAEMVGFGQLDVAPGATDTQAKVTLPAGVPTGQQDLFVVSGAGNCSDQYNIWVVADQPAVVGLSQSLVTPGQQFTIYGRYFASSLLPDVDSVTVQFDGGNPTQGAITAGSDPSKNDTVTVTAPASLTGPSTVITVINSCGCVSEPFTALVATGR